MHISKVELENIKSHVRSTYEFTRGTTAITGRNGAGKTSIIESIAWALFDLLDYKKEDFVRRGAKKGSVRVTFESGIDEREYVVYRDTGASYFVVDPRLQVRIADKKEEVFRFLWQHLGLEPGTDLRSLFRQAIGVPQGTFTAIFLEGAAERKIAFDRLLKVEEYRKAAESLRETSRFIERQLIEKRESVARIEGELSHLQTSKDEQSAVIKQIESLAEEVEKLRADVSRREAKVKEYDEKERRVSNLRLAVERANSEYDKSELIYQQAAKAFERSEKALCKLDTVRPEYERHINALKQLKKLESKRIARDNLKTEIARIDTEITNVRAEQKHINEELKKLDVARKKIDDLRSKVNEQSRLEQEIERLRNEIAAAESTDERIDSIERELGRLRKKYIENQRAKRKEEAAVNASKLNEVHKKLLARYEAREEEMIAEGKELSEKKEFLKKRQENLSNLRQQIAHSRDLLNKLADPAAQIRVLERELLREPEIRSRLSSAEDKLALLETDLRHLQEKLKDFVNFEAEWKQLTATRDATAADHRAYLTNETEAAALEKRKNELAKANAEREKALAAIKTAESELSAAGIDYDAAKHSAEREELRNAERRAAECHATLNAMKNRERQLAAEIRRFSELRKTLRNELNEKERLEKTLEVTTFIRDSLKEAAPRVARNYVHCVSIEANMLFREITGNAEGTLKWGEDYAISLEEDSFTRPFQSLSGGEQMAAALAVRLAILKQLSDIRIAFFDEPTTNMDAERRENFALEISRIKNFDQLFVISHDETFDNYVDNIVHVNKMASRSVHAA